MNPDTQEEWHVEKCKHLTTPLATCLEQHEDFYDNLKIYNDEEVIAEEDLQTAWTKVIHEVESNSERQGFPSTLVPQLQVRPSTGTGMAAFLLQQHKSQPLVLAYVKDDDTGELLAAGSRDDLWDWQDEYGVLRMALAPTTRSVTAYALYQGDQVLYEHTELVPPRSPTKDSDKD